MIALDMESQNRIVNCTFCGSNKKRKLYIVDGFRIVQCKECSLAFTENPIPIEKMNDLYGKNYFNISNEDDIKTDNENRNVRGLDESNAPLDRLKMLESLRKHGRLLELGCGTGGFLRLVKNKFETYGIDISKDAANFGRNKFGLNIMDGVLEDNDFPNKYFDVVLMWHLLEHLPKPYDSLKEINRILKKGGIVGIEVPNLKGLLWRLSKDKWKGGLHPKYHRHHFSIKALNKILKASGFNVMLLTTNWENYIYENSESGLIGRIKNVIRKILNNFKLGPIIRIYAKKVTDVK